MEFFARLNDGLTAPAATMKGAMVDLKGSILDASAALKDFDKASGGVVSASAAVKSTTAATPPAPRVARAPAPKADRPAAASAPNAAKQSPEEKAAEKAAKERAKAQEYVYQLRVRQQAAEEKAAEKADRDRDKRISATLSRNVAAQLRAAAEDQKRAAEDERRDAAKRKRIEAFKSKAAYVGAGAVAGGVYLASIAMGYRGMARLNALSFQASMNFRRLFVGVDPSPVLRAFDKLTQAFNPRSFTGSVLAGIFTRTFNGLFALVERAQPYVTAFGQGMVLAFLYAENAVLRARIALVPYEPLLSGITSKTSLMKTVAIGGGLALGLLAVYAATAAAPFVALGAAITAVSTALEQLSRLSKEWDEQSAGQLWRKLKADVGLGQEGGSDAERGVVTGADYDKMQAARKASAPAAQEAKAAGQKAGEALGDGMVAGMKAKEPAVAAGGKSMAKAADTGVKTEAKIKSPSRLMAENARYMGQGIEVGLRGSAPGVQRAAEDALVPKLPRGAPAGGGAVAAASSALPPINVNFYGPVGGNAAELRAAVSEAIDEKLQDIALALGVAVTR